MRTVFLAFVTLLLQLNLTVASKCKVRPLPKLSNGFVRVRKGVLHFTCRPGFDLEGHAKIKCHDFLKVPQCVPIQRDEEAKDYVGSEYDDSAEEYGDYYDYEYKDYDENEDIFEDTRARDYSEIYDDYDYERNDQDYDESYEDYDDADHGEDDDEDYSTEGSGDIRQTAQSTTLSTTTTSTTTTTTVTTTTTATTTTTTFTTTTARTSTILTKTTTMPTDDEDLVEEGSGDQRTNEGSGDIDDNDVGVEGSGEYAKSKVTQMSPEEIGNLRRAFYYEFEADLLRLDTSCQTQYISAPQIHNARIT